MQKGHLIFMSGSLISAGRSPTIRFGSFGVGLVHAGDLALSVGHTIGRASY